MSEGPFHHCILVYDISVLPSLATSDAYGRSSCEAVRSSAGGDHMQLRKDDVRCFQRIASLDALRGLTVLIWLVSATMGPALYQILGSGRWAKVFAQLSPSFWQGVTAFDLVLPMFLFVAGASIVPAFERRKAAGQTNQQLLWRIIRRVVLLVGIGLVCEGGLWEHWPHLRLGGAFQRIAICYAVAAGLELTRGWRLKAGIFVFLLVDYWIILALGGSGEGNSYSIDDNVAAAVDQALLPGRKFFGTWDPQGILTTIPAVAITTVGLIAGRMLSGTVFRPQSRSIWLFGIGAGMGGGGLLLGASLVPIDPPLWTVSFCLVAVGLGFSLLGLFQAIECRWNAALTPLAALGRNSLLVIIAATASLTLIDIGSPVLRSPLSLGVVASGVCAVFVFYACLLATILLDRRKIYVTV